MEGESGVIRTIIDELLLQISKEIKWKVKVVIFEISLMILLLPISNEIKWKVKGALLEV